MAIKRFCFGGRLRRVCKCCKNKPRGTVPLVHNYGPRYQSWLQSQSKFHQKPSIFIIFMMSRQQLPCLFTKYCSTTEYGGDCWHPTDTTVVRHRQHKLSPTGRIITKCTRQGQTVVPKGKKKHTKNPTKT